MLPCIAAKHQVTNESVSGVLQAGLDASESTLFRSLVALWTDLHGSADGDEVPDLVDLLVGDGDAAQSPVDDAVRGADEAAAVGKAVNHDVAARTCTDGGRPLAIVGTGIRDMQRFVIGGMRVAAVDNVVASGVRPSP
jgi:hypothetical protein